MPGMSLPHLTSHLPSYSAEHGLKQEEKPRAG